MLSNFWWWLSSHRRFKRALSSPHIRLFYQVLLITLSISHTFGAEETLSVTVTANKAPYFQCGLSQPASPSADGEGKVEHVSRHPLASAFCSSDFTYCSEGNALPGTCPQGLFYNPIKSDCDLEDNIKSCLADADKDQRSLRTSTAQKFYRVILDDPSFNDCSRRSCNYYPDGVGDNLDGTTFIFCVDGISHRHTCMEGTKFDIYTTDCEPADTAKIWELPKLIKGKLEPGNPVVLEMDPRTEAVKQTVAHRIQTIKEAEIRGRENFAPIVFDEETGVAVIQKLIIPGQKGKWSEFVACPKGTFLISLAKETGDSPGGCGCSNPGDLSTGERTVYDLEIPQKTKEIWKFLPDFKCAKGGVVVGFKMLPGEPVKFVCATDPLSEDEQKAVPGVFEFCPMRHATCGLSARSTADETTNVRMKCCPVPRPFGRGSGANSVPEEDIMQVVTCNNLKHEDDPRWRKCEFQVTLGGLTPIKDLYAEESFYLAAGYDHKRMWRSVKKKLKSEVKCKKDICMNDNWSNFDLIGPNGTTITKRVLVPPRTKVTLFQVYAKYEFFRIFSDRFLEVIEDGKSGEEFEELRKIVLEDGLKDPTDDLVEDPILKQIKAENISIMANTKKAYEVCDFYGVSTTTKYKQDKGYDDPATIISSPVVTNWGEWINWENCSEMAYVDKIKVAQYVINDGGKIDMAGAVQLAIKCQPLDFRRLSFKNKQGKSIGGGDESEQVTTLLVGTDLPPIEFVNPGMDKIPWNKKNKWDTCGHGLGVGFETFVVDQHHKDNVATEDVRLVCSCERTRVMQIGKSRPDIINKIKERSKIKKTKVDVVEDDDKGKSGTPDKGTISMGEVDSGGKVRSQDGKWTDKQICPPEKALTGLIPQFHRIKQSQLNGYDNTGLNNIKMRCQSVHSPAEYCIPDERNISVARCSNPEGPDSSPLSCVFVTLEGLTYNFTLEHYHPVINLMESVGHTLPCVIPVLQNSFKQLAPIETWEKPEEQQFWHGVADVTVKIPQIAVGSSVELIQTVGFCGPYIIYTNKYLKIGMNKAGDANEQEFELPPLEFDKIPYDQCWKDTLPIKMTPMKPPKSNLDPDDMEIFEYHEKNAANEFNTVIDGTIISSPQITDFGEWDESEPEKGWKFCPPKSYINSINIQRHHEKVDDAGVAHLHARCIEPGANKHVQEVSVLTPGLEKDDVKTKNFSNNWQSCVENGGVGVGFQLNSQADQGEGKDNVATDNVLLVCSAGPDAVDPLDHDVEDNGLKGDWSQKQYCRPKQALCGFKGQFRAYQKPDESATTKYDNTALDNIKGKCCDVVHPGKTCMPEEKKVKIGYCDNSIGETDRLCDIDLTIGVDYNSVMSQEDRLSRNFHESIGYTKTCAGKALIETFASDKLKCPDNGCAANWTGQDKQVWAGGKVIVQPYNIPAKTIKDVYQIVATCGYFSIFTNLFIIDDIQNEMIIPVEEKSDDEDESLCWEDNQAIKAALPAGGRLQVETKRVRFKRQADGYNVTYQFVTDGSTMDSHVFDTEFPDIAHWSNWEFCKEPEGGNAWYADSIFVERQSENDDLAGLVSVGFDCRNVKLNGEGDHAIMSSAPGAPIVDEGMRDWKKCSCGIGVGFQVSSVPFKWLGDDLGIESMKMLCSCSETIWKTKDDFPSHLSGLRGNWTEEEICRPRQALCGIQTRAAQFEVDETKAQGDYDNVGITKVKAKCCNVPNPAIACQAKEVIREIGVCDNFESSEKKKCNLESVIGITYDETNTEFLNEAKFYESIGWNLDCVLDELEENLSTELVDETNYKWTQPNPMVFQQAIDVHDKILVAPRTKATILQITAQCGPYVVATNRFVRRVSLVTKGEDYINEDYFGFRLQGITLTRGAQRNCWSDDNKFPARDYVRPKEAENYEIKFHGHHSTTSFSLSELSPGGIDIESHSVYLPIHKLLENIQIGEKTDKKDQRFKKEICGKNKYITGFSTDSLIKNGSGGNSDNLGMTHMMVRCRDVDRTERKENYIKHPDEELNMANLVTYTQGCVRGAIVGYQVSIHDPDDFNTNRDDFGIDNMKAICSYGKNLEFNRPLISNNFTEPAVVCRPHQAVCAITVHFGPKSVSNWQNVDGTGISRLQLDCCTVPNPAEARSDVPPSEAVRLVSVCDNLQFATTRRCEYTLHMGVTYDFEQREEESILYLSIGYCVPCILPKLKETFKAVRSEIVCERTDEDCNFNWLDASESQIFQAGLSSFTNMTRIKGETKLEIHQVIGKINTVLILTNSFIFTWKDKVGNKLAEEMFIIDLDNFPVLDEDAVTKAWDANAEITRESEPIRVDADTFVGPNNNPPLQVWNSTQLYSIDSMNKMIVCGPPSKAFEMPVTFGEMEWLEWVNCSSNMYVSHISSFTEKDGSGEGFLFKCTLPTAQQSEMRKLSTAMKPGEVSEKIDLVIGKQTQAENADNADKMNSESIQETDTKGNTYDLHGCPCKRAIGVKTVSKKNAAIHSLSIICSCGGGLVASKSSKKKEVEGEEYVSDYIYCKERTALCGFKLKNQINAILGVKIACCPVLSPATNCAVRERLRRVVKCDNSRNQITRRCLFDLHIGLTYNYKRYESIANFYEMTSWSLDCLSRDLAERFGTALGLSKATAYNWIASKNANPLGQEWDKMQMSSYNVTVKAMNKLEIYQVVGSCGMFIVQTDQFLISETLPFLGKVENVQKEISFKEDGVDGQPKLQRNPGICWMDNLPIPGQNIIVDQNRVATGTARFHQFPAVEEADHLYKMGDGENRTATQIQIKPGKDGQWPEKRVMCDYNTYMRKFGPIQTGDNLVGINFKCTTPNNEEPQHYSIKLPSSSEESAEKYSHATFGAYVGISPVWKSDSELSNLHLIGSLMKNLDKVNKDAVRQHCHAGQALCGMQAQWGGSGASNMRGICCTVPNPAYMCEAMEELRLAAVCDNTRDSRRRTCNVRFGLGVNYNFQKYPASSSFYKSIGYNPACLVHDIKYKFQEMNCKDGDCMFSWGAAFADIWDQAQAVPDTLEIEPRQKVEFYQVVGACRFPDGELLVLTNVFKRKVVDRNNVELKMAQYVLPDVTVPGNPNCQSRFMDLSVEPSTKPSVEPMKVAYEITHYAEQGLSCPYHGIPSSVHYELVEEDKDLPSPRIVLTGAVDEDIRNNIKTTWRDWKQCPADMYVNTLETYVGTVSDETSNELVDAFGVHQLIMGCGGPMVDQGVAELMLNTTPDGNPPNTRVHKPCNNGSAAVGFEVQIRNYQGPVQDDNAYVNFRHICSCGPPAVVDFSAVAAQDLLHGEWEEPDVCRAREAICGYIVESSDFFESPHVGWYDNVGISGINAKCCPIPSPVMKCNATERKLVAAKCKNPAGEVARKCEFDAYVGLAYTYNAAIKHGPNFYESVGWNLECVKEELSLKVGSTIKKTKHLDWEALILKVNTGEQIDRSSETRIYNRIVKEKIWIDMKENDELTVYQIVARCGIYRTYSNVFVVVDDKTKEEKIITMPELGNQSPDSCWADASLLEARNWVLDSPGKKATAWVYPMHNYAFTTKNIQRFLPNDGTNRAGIIVQMPNPPRPVFKFNTPHTCPPETYIRTISVKKEVLSDDDKVDIIGAVAISYHCMSPDTTSISIEKNHINSAWIPKLDTWRRENFGDPGSRYQYCLGAAVGVEIEVSPISEKDDDYGIFDIRLLCGYGKSTDFGPRPVEADNIKPEVSRDLVCRPRQALCHAHPAFGKPPAKKKDNIGLTNIKFACCDVPSPLDGGEGPREEKVLASTCFNGKYNRVRFCKYTGKIGISYNLRKHDKSSFFYMSIGYSATCIAKQAKEKFKGIWSDMPEQVFQEEAPFVKVIQIPPKSFAMIYQIIGEINNVQIMTNKFEIVYFNKKKEEVKRDTVVEDILPPITGKKCEVQEAKADFPVVYPPAIPIKNLDPPQESTMTTEFKDSGRGDFAMYKLSSDGSNYIEGPSDHDEERNHLATWDGYEWTNCTQKGQHYFTGFRFNLGKINVKSSTNEQEVDQAGVQDIGMQCTNVKTGQPDNQILVQTTRGSDVEANYFDTETVRTEGYHCEGGVGIGFALGQKPFQKLDDDEATDDFKMICSVGKDAEGPERKRKLINSDKGEVDRWTEARMCRPKEATCGITIRAQDIKRDQTIRRYDNIAISNIRMKCCTVPNPGAECMVSESLVTVAECDNLGQTSLKRCSVPLYVGFTYAHTKEHEFAVKTYESIGWSLGCLKHELGRKFTSIMDTNYYNWTQVKDDKLPIWNEITRKVKMFNAEGKSKVVLKQVIGLCGIYKLYTDNFVLTAVNAAGESVGKEVVKYDDIAGKKPNICWETEAPIKGRDWAVSTNTQGVICPERSSFPVPSKQEIVDPQTDNQITDPDKNGFILSMPIPPSPFKTWGDWTFCPTGTYVRGWTSVASGKGIKEDKSKDDYSGIVFIKLSCQAPDNNKKMHTYVDILQDGSDWDLQKWTDEGSFGILRCLGAGIGLQTKVNLNPARNDDKFFMHDTKLVCSCGEHAGFMREGSDARGKKHKERDAVATTEKMEVCKTRHAVCGLKVSWGPPNQGNFERQDGYGISNIKALCCKIPSPVSLCETVTERLIFASTCDNSRGSVKRKCMQNLVIGISYIYEDDRSIASSYFYSSNGFTPSCIANELRTKFTTSPPSPCSESGCKYDWAGAPIQVWQDALVISNDHDVEPHQRYRMFQVIGECGSIRVYTNQFVKVIADENAKELKRTPWISADLPPAKLIGCEN